MQCDERLDGIVIEFYMRCCWLVIFVGKLHVLTVSSWGGGLL